MNFVMHALLERSRNMLYRSDFYVLKIGLIIICVLQCISIKHCLSRDNIYILSLVYLNQDNGIVLKCRDPNII